MAMEISDKSMRDLLHYHKTGTDYISKALSIDEISSFLFILTYQLLAK